MITPGPWKESEGYIYSEEGDHYTIIADVGVDHDPEGAIFAGNQTPSTDEQNANIELIKSAPDLLEAAQQLWAAIECNYESCKDDGIDSTGAYIKEINIAGEMERLGQLLNRVESI